MTKKIRTLLQINTMMKQNAEQQLAELSQKRLSIGKKIRSIQSEIEGQQKAILNTSNLDNLHLDAQTFEKWKLSQQKKIQNHQSEDVILVRAQRDIKTTIAELIVKDTYFKNNLKMSLKQRALKQDSLEAERTQNIWLQNKI